ncbi:MAG: hypothetical protein QMD80_05155 [archaeon]|nr:hypothetical protein [archaeon]
MQIRITSTPNDPIRYERRKTIHIDIACPTTKEKKALSSEKKRKSKREDMESPRRKLTKIKNIHMGI